MNKKKPEEIIERMGSIFRIGENVDLTYSQTLKQWANEGRIEFTLVEFVENVIVLCIDDPEHMTDIHMLIDTCNKSRAYLLRFAKKLVELNIFEKDSYKQPFVNKRSSSRYTLRPLEEIAPPPLEFATSTLPVPSEQILLHTLDEEEYSFEQSCPYLPATLNENSFIKGELFTLYTLPFILPANKEGKDQFYNAPLRIGKDVINIEVRPTQGTKVPYLTDVLPLFALTTIISGMIEEGIDTNPFVIDFNDIYQLVRMGNSSADGGSQKSKLLSQIKRWESTGFRIVSATKGFRDLFNGHLEIEEVFRVITKLKIASSVNSTSKTPDSIAVYLDDDLLKRLKDPKSRFLLSSHIELLKEQKPFYIQINLWCRRAIKHNHSARAWSLTWIAKEINNESEFKYFNREFKAFYNTHYDENLGCARYLGYCFKKDDRYQPGVRGTQKYKQSYYIWADPDDRLVGTQSHHQFMKSIENEKHSLEGEYLPA